MNDDQLGDRAHPTPRRAVLLGTAGAAAAGLGLAGVSGCAARPTRPKGPVDLGSTDQVAVGGATLFREDKVVVAQPTRGVFKAFSAVCTHAGCVVDKIERGVISCPCHGSRFDALTGAVEQGPAPSPLPPVELDVHGGKLTARF